jgi:hypothetical protein
VYEAPSDLRFYGGEGFGRAEDSRSWDDKCDGLPSSGDVSKLSQTERCAAINGSIAAARSVG